MLMIKSQTKDQLEKKPRSSSAERVHLICELAFSACGTLRANVASVADVLCAGWRVRQPAA